MTRILVVEDQRTLLRNLVGGLEEEGYEVLAAASIGEGRAAILRQPDVLVLDLMLPDGSGIELLRQLRSDGFTRPILVLTARDSVDDRVEGLDAGADDYLVKPFSFNELLAQLRALSRRGSLEQQAILRLEGLEVDRLKRVATRNGQALELSNRQFELLSYLMQHANTVVNREMIARDVWRESTATWTNVIEVHIAQLRRKIERPDWPQILHTVRGRDTSWETAHEPPGHPLAVHPVVRGHFGSADFWVQPVPVCRHAPPAAGGSGRGSYGGAARNHQRNRPRAELPEMLEQTQKRFLEHGVYDFQMADATRARMFQSRAFDGQPALFHARGNRCGRALL